MQIEKIQKNLSKNMLIYTLLMMVLGFSLGYLFDLKWMSNLILPIVFIMIYPMMVNISLSHLKHIKGSMKPLIEALILNFIIAPALFFVLTIPLTDERIRLALLLLAVAPASSMGLGYLGLAEGHMISGAIIVAIEFIIAILVFPLAGMLFTTGTSIIISPWMLIEELLIVLVTPLILGIITREYIERKHEEGTYKKIKPYFGTVTLIFLYALIFTIFATKANLILKNYINILLIAPIAILYYGITILITVIFNKNILKLEYGKHQAVIFTSIAKNVALTIAILIAVFQQDGQYMAIAPAIVSLFQAPILMLYLKSHKIIRKHLAKNSEEIIETIPEEINE
ncbi:MAG: arsenic resistance protein [Promethearchaeota archaeon]